MLCSPLKLKGTRRFPMTTFRCKKEVITLLAMACCTGLSSAFATDETLEEIIVSGVKDPRSGALISGSASRLVSPANSAAPLLSVGELVGRLPGAASITIH